jgi:hypothetical protein
MRRLRVAAVDAQNRSERLWPGMELVLGAYECALPRMAYCLGPIGWAGHRLAVAAGRVIV